MGHFVRTDTFLDKILAHKVDEIAACQRIRPLSELREAIRYLDAPRDVLTTLSREAIALIAEVKKASPSKGVLIENFDAVALAQTYADHGASMISVLTDEQFFQGALEYLTQVKRGVSVPVLRKDFIIDPYQVYEARTAGADAMLLIVGALDNVQLRDLYALAVELGMTPLVEVHTAEEMERALAQNVALVGVNNRDLKTFEVELATTERLTKMVPASVVLVAESGIHSTADVKRMAQAGAHAILVGESLVKAGDDLPTTVRAFSSVQRHSR